MKNKKIIIGIIAIIVIVAVIVAAVILVQKNDQKQAEQALNDYINLINEKDYVTNPKKSGYSSYHMVLEVPIILSQKTMYVKVELQIRTMAMDFWATLEHRMKYKSSVGYSEECSKEFIKFAKTITSLDNKIEKLYEKQHGKNNIVVLKR